MTAHTDVSRDSFVTRTAQASPDALLVAGVLLIAVMAAAGTGPLTAAVLPFLFATGFALLGQASPWLWLLVAFSGVGLSWAEGAVQLGGWSINIAGLQWGFTFVMGALLLVLLPRTGRAWPTTFRWYALFVAVAVLWVLKAPSLFSGVKHAVQYAAPLAVGLVTLRIADRPGQVQYLRGALWAAFILAAAVGIVSVQWLTFSGDTAGLAGAIGNRPFAIFLIPIYALALAGWRMRGPAYAIIAAVAFAFIVLTLSRTVTATALVLAAIALMWDATWAQRLRGAVVVALLGVLIVSFEPLRDRFITGEGFRQPSSRTALVTGAGRNAQLNVSGISLSGRGLLWLQTWRHAMQSPVTGHGTGSAETYLGAELQSVTAQPHNDYLRVFHDGGAIGLAALLATVVAGIISLRKLQRRSRSVLGRELALAAFLSWLGYLMIAVTDNILVYVSFFTQNLFLLIALAHVTVDLEVETTPAGTARDGAVLREAHT